MHFCLRNRFYVLQCLLPLLFFPYSTISTELVARADCCIGHCPDDENGEQAVTLDGPTSDGAPGIGVEFEAGDIQFGSEDCQKRDRGATEASKGKLAGNRQGTNWQLTADTTLDAAGFLTAEYILDGTQIKLGTNMAGPAADAVANDAVRMIDASTTMI